MSRKNTKEEVDWKSQVKGSVKTAALNSGDVDVVNETADSLIEYLSKVIDGAREGWHSLIPAQRPHYFAEGKTLCRNAGGKKGEKCKLCVSRKSEKEA